MSKRLNLLEFQQNLIGRLQGKGESVAKVTTLGVQIAGSNWLIDMPDISVVLLLPRLTIVPFTKPWFRGMANIHGNLYSVVDMAAYQQSVGISQRGAARASDEAGNRVLLVAERFVFNVALLVDCVLGLHDTQSWCRSETEGQSEYIDEQGISWRKLDVKSLLEEQEFLQIGI